MIFDTFLYRFDLCTGCMILAVMHLITSIAALENVTHLATIYFYLVLSERIFEMSLSLFLLYASYKSNRGLLKAWMLCISPVYLFNVSYGGYESLIKYDTLLGFILLVTIYVQTISLMMVYSFYNELGYIENHLKDLAELRALRSASINPGRPGKGFEEMEMLERDSIYRKSVRTTIADTSRRATRSTESDSEIDINRNPSFDRTTAFDSTSLLRADDEETDYSHMNTRRDSSAIIKVSRSLPRREVASSEMEVALERTYTPRTTRSRPSKSKRDSI